MCNFIAIYVWSIEPQVTCGIVFFTRVYDNWCQTDFREIVFNIDFCWYFAKKRSPLDKFLLWNSLHVYNCVYYTFVVTFLFIFINIY